MFRYKYIFNHRLLYFLFSIYISVASCKNVDTKNFAIFGNSTDNNAAVDIEKSANLEVLPQMETKSYKTGTGWFITGLLSGFLAKFALDHFLFNPTTPRQLQEAPYTPHTTYSILGLGEDCTTLQKKYSELLDYRDSTASLLVENVQQLNNFSSLYKECSGDGKYPNATNLYQVTNYNLQGNISALNTQTQLLDQCQSNLDTTSQLLNQTEIDLNNCTYQTNICNNALASWKNSYYLEKAAFDNMTNQFIACAASLQNKTLALFAEIDKYNACSNNGQYPYAYNNFVGICNAGLYCQAGNGCGQNHVNTAVRACTYAGNPGSDVNCGSPMLGAAFGCP